MQLGSYVFKPHLGIFLLAIILIPLCIRLGYWQLDRGAQRRALQVSLEQRLQQEPIVLTRRIDDPTKMRFRPVKVRGRFDKEHEFILDNMVNNGEAGYHVITPLQIEGMDIRVLINRGWIPLGNDRSILPRIKTPDETVSLHGSADMFSKTALTLGKMEPIKDTWPKRWTYMDAERFSKAAGYEIQPFVILEDKDSPYGFKRNWDREFFKFKYIINMGYAVQWFTFSVIILATFIGLSIRKSPANKTNKWKDVHG